MAPAFHSVNITSARNAPEGPLARAMPENLQNLESDVEADE
jgi:hypothetical protein